MEMSGLGVCSVNTGEKSTKEGGTATEGLEPPSSKHPDSSVVKSESTLQGEDITDNAGEYSYSFTPIKDERIEIKMEEIDIDLEDDAATSEVLVPCANENGIEESEVVIKEGDIKEENSLCLPPECITERSRTAVTTVKEKDLERDVIANSQPSTVCGIQNLSPRTITPKGINEKHGNEFNSPDCISSSTKTTLITGIPTSALLVLNKLFRNDAKAVTPQNRPPFCGNTPLILKRRPLFKPNLLPRDRQSASSSSCSLQFSLQRCVVLSTSSCSEQSPQKSMILNRGATTSRRKQHLCAHQPSTSSNHPLEPRKFSSEGHPKLVESGKSRIFNAGNGKRITIGIQRPVVLKSPCDDYRRNDGQKLGQDGMFSKVGINEFQSPHKSNVSKKTCSRTQSKKLPSTKPVSNTRKSQKKSYSTVPISKKPSLCENRPSNAGTSSKPKVEVQSLLAFLSNEESSSGASKRTQGLKQCSVADEQSDFSINCSSEFQKLNGSKEPANEIGDSAAPCPDPGRLSSLKQPLSETKDGPSSKPHKQLASLNNFSSESTKLHNLKSHPTTCVGKQSYSSPSRVFTYRTKDVAEAGSAELSPERLFMRMQCPSGSEIKDGTNSSTKPITNVNSNPKCNTITLGSLSALSSDKESSSSGTLQVLFKSSTAYETLKNLKQCNTDEGLFFCSECLLIFKTRVEIEEHLSVHLKGQSLQAEKTSFSCEHCAAAFRTKSALEQHSVNHSDMRPFVCKDCAAAFKSKCNLKRHSAIHSDIRPFICKHCATAFKRKCSLEQHLVTHSVERPFSCELCAAQFKTMQALKLHSATHSDKTPFSCELCAAQFKTVKALKLHSVTHSDKRPFFCDHCAAAYKRKVDLKRHLVTHSDETPFFCEHCAAAFKTKDSLRLHLITHSDKKPFSCEHCDAAFKTRSELLSHSVTHSDKRPFSCEHCTAVFKTKRVLARHLITHSVKRPFSCDHCTAIFKTKSALKLHIRRHSDKMKFSCEHCDAAFKTRSELLSHSVTHSNTRPFSCEQCAASFRTKQALKVHSVTHLEKRPFSCEHCTAAFKRKNTLKRHLDTVHSGSPFSCKYCEAVFQTRTDLRHHAEIHANKKRFLCEQCSAAFWTKCELKSHLNVHSDEKLFLCELCAALFKTAQQLRLHSFVHSDQKPFVCAHCSAAFKSKNIIKNHLKVHSSNRPFSCLECDASFRKRTDLKRHFLKHSDERPFSCPNCSGAFKTKGELKIHSRRCSINPKQIKPRQKSEQKQFPCQVCAVAFKTNDELKRHSAKHLAEMSPSCELCSASFKSKLQVEKHLLSVHSSEEGSLFACKHCAATFNSAVNIKRHLMSHSTKRPFKCEHCSDTFKDKKSVTVHIIRHSGKKPYACPRPHCNAKFYFNHLLQRHLVLHGEERRYSCAHCSATFKAKVNLKQHMAVHSKKKPFLCSFCATRFKSKLGFQYHVKHAHGKKI